MSELSVESSAAEISAFIHEEFNAGVVQGVVGHLVIADLHFYRAGLALALMRKLFPTTAIELEKQMALETATGKP